MLEPLLLFGGLYSIPMYSYYWVMTSAQIELLAMDTPIVTYDRKGEKKHTKSELDKLKEDYYRRKKEEEANGTRVDLQEFLVKGKESITQHKHE